MRVAYYEDGDFMSVNGDGQYCGYNIEYLDEIGRYANWTYEYVDYPSWEQAYAALEAGDVDILPAVYKTAERENTMLFSASSMCSIYTTLNVRLDDTRFAYEDFQAFSGMRVGVIEGSADAQAFIDYSEDNGFSVDVVAYAETDELLAALDEGELDAVGITYLGSNSQFRTVAQFAPAPLYFAFPRDRASVAKQFDAAFGKLELSDPNFTNLLYDHYFSINKSQDPVFTGSEYDYIAEAPTLRVAYDAFRTPLVYADPETGEFAGVAAKLFEDISRITGLNFEFVAVEDHQQAIDMAENGEVDIIAGVDRDVDEATGKGVLTTVPYLRDPLGLVTGQNADIGVIALPESYSYSSETEQLKTSYDIVYQKTPKQCLDALLAGTVDAAYMDSQVASYLLSESQYRSLTAATITDYTNNMSIGVSSQADERLLSILDRCVQYTDDRKMRSWLSQSSLAVHPTSLLDFFRQYPLQFIGAFVTLLIAIILIALYLGRTRLRTARRIEQLSFTDPLTGGWSLSRFRMSVGDLLRTADGSAYALVYLDIARFKSFNAAFGYAAGDELLKSLDHLLGEMTRDGECHARITADEFVALLRWTNWEDFMKWFTQLDKRFNELGMLRARSHQLLLYAGVCIVEQEALRSSDAQVISEMMDCARYARDNVGDVSESQAALYTEDMKECDVAERALMASARNALQRGEFVAYYQPKVALASNRIVSLEALVRWKTPEGGIVAPGDFIPLFEKNGFVTEIDLHILRLVCQRLKERLESGDPVVPIACNFSRIHLRNDLFPETVKAVVDEYGLPSDLIELELTESIVMEDLEHAKRTCQQLKALGFRISIDDFGSGYSSLGTLQDLTIDVLKLDRTFLMSSESGERSKTILEGVVGIAEKLGVAVVVEGVETRDQASMLLGIDSSIIAQGYLFSRPVPRSQSDAQLDAGKLVPGQA